MPFPELLLQTKLFIPPSRPDLVARPRLLDQLSDCLNRALTVVSAPAGFGKTTLLATWVAQVARPASIPVAWVALEADDNEGQRFLVYLLAALERALEQAAQEGRLPSSAALDIMLASPEHTPAATLLGPLINDLSSLASPLVVMLDDYHLITNRAVHEALAFLLDHLPPQLHLVLATRADPPVPVARLRARRQLAEIRSTDLRFTLEETLAFLNQAVHLDLSIEDIQALETRTEGWIAGLQMAALSLQGRPDPSRFIEAFSGSHRFILDYLAEEVINRLPAHVQEFLLLTSPLERLCATLCDAILQTRELRITARNRHPLPHRLTRILSSPEIARRCWPTWSTPTCS